MGVMPPASLGAGWLLTVAGARSSVLVLAAVMLGCAVAASLSPAVRRAPALPAAGPPDAGGRP
ncbi:hypothetical protein [Actinacidiphila acidipaludis]|uniref:MFS transporter n=1 Tax=Actinacidiphila acidipaludis TaxID=2873382 RepID=A0ABS7QG08_9ACTN|nr:hypothetical protein [Streptomyces acidipaludis]MBY8882099.1 hypothetical protein [Streptomyces acidipaludis]